MKEGITMNRPTLKEVIGDNTLREFAEVNIEGWDVVEKYFKYSQISSLTAEEFINNVQTLDMLLLPEYSQRLAFIKGVIDNIGVGTNVNVKTNSHSIIKNKHENKVNAVNTDTNDHSLTHTDNSVNTTTNSSRANMSGNNSDATNNVSNSKDSTESNNNSNEVTKNNDNATHLEPELYNDSNSNGSRNSNDKTTGVNNNQSNSTSSSTGSNAQESINSGSTKSQNSGDVTDKGHTTDKHVINSRNVDTQNDDQLTVGETITKGIALNLSSEWAAASKEYYNLNTWFVSQASVLFATITTL